MYVFCAFHLHSGSKGIIPESLSLLCPTLRNFTLKIIGINPLSANKMVKHTQTIHRQIADELFERVWPFCETDA